MKRNKQTYLSKKDLIKEQESCIDFAIQNAKDTGKFKMPEHYLETFLELAISKKTYHNLEYENDGFLLRLQNGVWINPRTFIVSKKYKFKHDNYFTNFGTKDALSGTYNLKSGKETEYNTYLQHIEADLRAKKKHNKKSIERLASTYGIINKNLIKETTELAIVKIARSLANQKDKSEYERYLDIVELYKNQVNLSHRTSQSMLMQQYSTAAPISYIASLYVSKDNDKTAHYFEPSAGNGLLTIALPMHNTIVNEVDDVRLRHLQMQEFEFVSNQDALMPFPDYYKKFDGVVTNPPFGTLDEAVIYDNFRIKHLDHVMTLRALDTMKDDGKAAIIIGGHTAWDNKGRVQSGKNRIFLNYLYSHYNVDDILLINGHKLYSRQGTAFNTRLILIDGRKEKKEGFAPLKTSEAETEMKDFDDLWERVFGIQKQKNKTLKKTYKPKNKQAWEMTSKELIKSTLENMDIFKDQSSANWFKENSQVEVIDKRTGKSYNHYLSYKVTPAMLKKNGKEAHYNLIKKALRQGKYVPENVLAEYSDLLIPKVVSARKYKSDTCFEAFDFVRNIQTYCYQVHFEDGRLSWFGNAKDRKEAIEKAIENRHEGFSKSEQRKKTNNEKRIRIAKVKAKAKLKLLNIVSLDGVQTNILSVQNEYNGISNRQIPKLAEKFYKENIQGKTVVNNDKNIEIVFVKKGMEKSTRGRHIRGRHIPIDSILATSVNYLLELMQSAVFSGYRYNLKPNHKKMNGYRWWNFYSKIIIDNQLYLISIPVLEIRKGANEFKMQYAVEYSNIKKILAGKRTL